MFTTLLQRFFGSALLLLLLLNVRPAQASHLLGGEMSYSYLDANGPTAAPFRYQILVTLYINRKPGTAGQPFTNMPVAIYNRTTGAKLNMTTVNYPTLAGTDINLLNPVNSGNITGPPIPIGCAVQGPSQPFLIQKFSGTVNLPVSFDGYYAIVMPNARNIDILNIDAANNNTPLTLYVSMAPPLIFNRSPVFSDTAVAIICQNDTTISLNNAADPDGDRLVYSFGSPYGTFTSSGAQFPGVFPPLPNPVPYKPGFSLANPFGSGAGNFALLNANTGIAKYGTTGSLGNYVVAVDVSEYRTINGREILIGTTRRDLQLVVSTCPPTPPPVLPPASGGTPRNYTIEEGQSLSIPISATQTSANHPLVLTVNSVLLDGSGPFNTTFNGSTGTVVAGNLTGTATASGINTVSGTFIFNSVCGNGRTAPYDLAVTVKDNGCGGKLASDIFRITVNRAAGPTAITGPITVCDPATVRTYTASGPATPTYNWVISGGTITSGQGTSTVQVTWNNATATGTLTLNGVSTYGCATTPVVQTVDIRPLVAPNVSPASPTICRGSLTTLSVTPQTGLTYTWTGGSITSTGPSITVSPTATTTYTLTGTDGTCTTTATVTVTVTPPPVANAGPDLSLCSSVTSAVLGTPAVAGVTYSWGPATGLSSTSVAQPTVTLTNTTGAPIIRNYGLTASTAVNCQSTDSVRVTINPSAIANAGPAVSTCSDVASAPIGTVALPGYTYSWAPATGLSSTTTAQPTVTLPNTTGAVITQTYTLTATNAQGCTATSTVVVSISPAAVATPGPAISFCSGTTSAQLGGTATPVAGTTYSWSPTTNLSNPNILNPTVTGTNTTGAPITTTYILTATTGLGCISTASVAVTINPAAVANAGAAVTFCGGGSATLGSAPVAGTIYSWSPAPGLSSTTVANPTVTGTNTTGAPVTTTYTLTATTADGCTASGTVAVTVNPSAVATPGPAVSICSGGAATLGTAPIAGTTYSWTPATGLSSATASNPTVTGTNSTGTPITTTFTLTATTANGCTATGTVAVTINPAAVADAGPNRTICSGGSVQVGPAAVTGIYSFSWSPATGLSSTTVSNPTVTLTNLTGAPITQTYTLTVSTLTTPICTATSTVIVTVNPAAVANAGAAVAFCSGGTAALGSGTAVAGTTYAWTPTTGLSDPTVINPSITLTNTTGAPITTTYTLTATTASGCTASGTVAVTVNQAAVANAGPARTTCSNVGITIGSGTAVTGTTYAWTPATGLSSATSLTPTLTLANTGTTDITQTYTLTSTTANGCIATGNVTVTVFPAAGATPGPALAFCSGETRTLGTGTAVTGTTYAWSPATGLSDPTVLTPTITLTNTTGAPVTYTYTLLATTANGCTASGTVAVTVNQAAVANAGPARTTCSNVGITIGSGTAVTGTTYAWTPTTGLSSATSLTPTLTLANTTGGVITNTYTLTATTAQGCTATSTVAVTINPAAVAQAGVDKATCSNVGVTIGTGTAITGTTYAWTPATGLSSASVLTPTVTLPNLTGAAITQQYILLATTANGCFQRDTVVVTINPAAVAVAGTSRAICSGATTTLGAAAVTGSTYSWSPATGLSSATVANPTFTLANTGTTPNPIVFTLTATTANGCVATSTVTVTVNPAAVANAGPAAAVCDGKRITLGTPAQTGYTYSWSPATNLSSATVAQPILTGVNTGTTPITRTYTVTATTADGCVSTSPVFVTINPRPLPSAITGPASVCPTVTGIAYSVVNPVGTAFTWLINGGTIASGQGTPAITVNWGVASTGGYVKVFSLNTQGCSSDTTTLPIIINQRLQTVRPTGPGDIVAVAPLPRSVCQADGPYTYVSGAFAAGSSYSWQIIGGTQVSTSLNTATVNWAPVTVPTLGKIIVTETSNPTGGICRGVSDTLKVLINPSPRTNLAITAPVRVCQTNGPVTFALPGGFTGSTYVFQLAGATVAGTGSTRTLTTLPAPGTYPLTAQETTVAGCVGPLYTTQFTVSPTPGAPTISGSGFVCNVTTPQQYSISNPTAGSSYQWTVVGGTVTSGNGTSQVTVQFGATGPYTVSAAETSGTPASCVGATATRTILLDNPTVVLTTASVDLTSNSRVILTLRTPASGNTPNAVQILRRVAGGTGAFVAVGTIPASGTTYTDNNAVDAAGNSYEYRLDLTNGCGTLFSSPVSRTIRLVAVATPGAGGRDQGSTALTWNAYQGFTVDKYEIYRRTDTGTPVLVTTVPASTATSFQATVSNTDPNTVGTSVGFDQNFRIVAVSTDATPLRSNSNEANVKFENNTNVYNVITPNHDGLNDVLVIDNITLYPGNTFTVFNRWGREVYKTTNYQNNWGQDDNIAPGNYFYILTRPNSPTVKNWFEVVK